MSLFSFGASINQGLLYLKNDAPTNADAEVYLGGMLLGTFRVNAVREPTKVDLPKDFVSPVTVTFYPSSDQRHIRPEHWGTFDRQRQCQWEKACGTACCSQPQTMMDEWWKKYGQIKNSQMIPQQKLITRVNTTKVNTTKVNTTKVNTTRADTTRTNTALGQVDAAHITTVTADQHTK
jgi:hypothetical protein